MERQHGVPILLSSSSRGAQPLKHLTERDSGDWVSEAFPAGNVDVFMVTPSGLPVSLATQFEGGTGVLPPRPRCARL